MLEDQPGFTFVRLQTCLKVCYLRTTLEATTSWFVSVWKRSWACL